ncbi:hypothetical protein RGV33_25360 [Pseudomonas sp. Bout1]|uniref:hypothetical protein n=2 Tax=Pseudomonas sp. Bout1 TaxID=3048600 RepID=UPI002AB3B94D|nr:hypothetical protein [Pseudomonas sp. Bout1]MDY7534964.1 hypothetical protein [Pseudomonas sp. Bout1]MEB0187668.1 hypothetical protein [Pseudomonas sp. Bout1]
MDEKSRKVTASGAPCLFKQSVLGDSSVPLPCAPTVSKGVVFGSDADGAIVNSAAYSGSLEFGAINGYGPRFEMPGPMMRTVRDPSLSLIALNGVDPEGPVMVQVPPVADAGQWRSTLSLAGSRIGFACECVAGGVRETIQHSAQFARVLNALRMAGAELVPVQALVTDNARHFTLDSSNEINDRVAENRLDGLVSDAQSTAFHQASTAGNPSFRVPVGMGADGVSTVIWFYGAHWSAERLAALVLGCRNVLGHLQMPTPP